jgi:type IV pilus assembly protein PilW
MHARSQGVSLVELMVAVTLALITVLAVMQVLTVYESRKRTSMSSNDSEIGAAVGLHMIEREVRMAGAGLTLPAGFACSGGANIFYAGATISDGQPLAPLQIVDGGNGPDRILVFRSDAAFGVAPATITQNMANPSSGIIVDSSVGLATGDLAMVGGSEGTKTCTLMQMSAAPDELANGWELSHSSVAVAPYNPPVPAATFSDAPAYEVGDIVVNLGSLGRRAYGVICNDGAAPSAGNSCDLASWDVIRRPGNPALAQTDSITPHVVNLQAQYGVAPANSQTVNEWVDATGVPWAAPGAADVGRIKAVRLAIITRSDNREPEMVSPARLVLWDDTPEDPDDATIMPLGDDERRYRYSVLRVVVPLVNVIWAGV